MRKILILLIAFLATTAMSRADDTWSVAGTPASIFGAEWDEKS